MRRLALLLLGAACAQPGAPPGGPPDKSPPELLRIRPDTNARNVRPGAVTLYFDDVVSERPSGASGLAGLFLISPSIGDPSVSWHRTRIEVRPKGGYRPNTTYTVTMLPGMTDLEGNVDSIGTTLVFSTGATIAQGRITGVAFDWVGDKAAPNALVEAISLPDSAHYRAVADSMGGFVVAHLPNGRFLLRALIDANRNRLVDPREAYDTTTVVLTDSLRRLMYAFVHDTLGPAITTVAVRDSVTLKVTLDHPLDTTLVISPALFTLRAPDSSSVPVIGAITQRAFDQRVADSLRAIAVQDSIKAAAVADSARRADSARVNTRLDRGRRPEPVQEPPPRDTSRREPPKPQIRIPSSDVLLTIGARLAPATIYRLEARGLRSLLGREKDSERVFRTPRPDTTRRDSTKKDTTARDTVRPPARIRPDTSTALFRWLGMSESRR